MGRPPKHVAASRKNGAKTSNPKGKHKSKLPLDLPLQPRPELKKGWHWADKDPELKRARKKKRVGWLLDLLPCSESDSESDQPSRKGKSWERMRRHAHLKTDRWMKRVYSACVREATARAKALSHARDMPRVWEQSDESDESVWDL